MTLRKFLSLLVFASFSVCAQEWPILKDAPNQTALPGTVQLDWEGDLATKMVEGADTFLDHHIVSALTNRSKPTLEGLARILGTSRDSRPKTPNFEYLDWLDEPRAIADNFQVRKVRWRAFGEVHGEGLLLSNPNQTPVLDVIAIPDASQSPEDICAMSANSFSQTHAFALQLARSGCRVLVPQLINRNDHSEWKMPNREWLHRPAYELGRTLAGYETQKVLAGVDCLLQMHRPSSRKLAVVGWGEGGRLALYAAALDQRIDSACVSGYFGIRGKVWNEPADRTVFGLLHGYADAEIASLVSPRPLLIESGPAPRFVFRATSDGEPEHLNSPANKNGKPGKLIVPTDAEIQTEFDHLDDSAALLRGTWPLGDNTLQHLMKSCGVSLAEHPEANARATSGVYRKFVLKLPHRRLVTDRHENQMREIERHNEWALKDAAQVRAKFFKGLKTDSLEAFSNTSESYREIFRSQIIGKFSDNLLPLNPRTRKYQEGPKTVSYEVVLDVFPNVFAYGILTLPKDLNLSGKEQRPVVVCQHGLEGRPQDVVGEPKFLAYKAFATRLAERGYITFAPQNLYIGFDHFRKLQFKANALGCTLFSLMVPQHEQITDWLAALPFVAPDRIAFYGLSYGGKSAMRIPPLVPRYALSICSGDFNEWIWKNAATDQKSLRYSYANKREYEMFEFNLGNTFNYSEMAALIAPRPFMVERGHFDGVAPDEKVAEEYAKVRFLYAAQLGIADRTEIEWFAGPHAINGVASFEFLDRFLLKGR